jgi:hypothetical protein
VFSGDIDATSGAAWRTGGANSITEGG